MCKIKNCLIFFTLIIVTYTNKYFISPQGSDSNSGSLSSPFKSLYKAYTACDNGDDILILNGVYSDDANFGIKFFSKEVSIMGMSDQVIFNCNYRQIRWTISNTKIFISSISLTNGCENTIIIGKNATLTLINVFFKDVLDGIVSDDNVGVEDSSTVSIYSSTFQNTVFPGIDLKYTALDMRKNIFNKSSVFMANSSAKIDSNTFANSNVAGAIWAGDSSLIIENSVFINNQGIHGSGIQVFSASLTLDNVTMIGGSAEYGGAIFLASSTLSILDSNFSKNNASEDGGVIYCYSGSGSIENSIFLSNSADNHNGVGYCTIECNLKFENDNQFKNNSPPDGDMGRCKRS